MQQIFILQLFTSKAGLFHSLIFGNHGYCQLKSIDESQISGADHDRLTCLTELKNQLC